MRQLDQHGAEIRDHFTKFIDNDDGFWVAEVTNWATWKTKTTPSA